MPLLILALLANVQPVQSAVWINEITYEHAGTDSNEFVEIVLSPDETADISSISLTLYNGANGGTYNSFGLSTFTLGSVVNGFSIYSRSLPTDSLQNGAPDALALSISNTLVSGQFLSYEGTFLATNGVAVGVTSTDMGVFQTTSTPLGQSLQLQGTGSTYAAHTWVGPSAFSPGAINSGQSLIAIPEPSSAMLLGIGVFAITAYRRRKF